MKRNVILHLGAEKTGSTSLQNFMHLNSDQLNDKGFHYCESLGRPNNRRLCLYAMDRDRDTQLHKVFGLHDPMKAEHFADMHGRLFNEEMDSLPGHIHTVILSNEHCRSNLIHEREVDRIRRLTESLGGDVRILVYLRRQVDMAVSHYSSFLKTANYRPTILPEVSPEIRYFNYRIMLELWEKVFSREWITVRLYAEEGSPGGKDQVADFLSFCGLSEDPGFTPVPPMNQSLDPVAQELLRRINTEFPLFNMGELNDARRDLIQYLQARHSGRGRMPDRESARRFQAIFDADNEWIRERWFPDRTSLFDDCFDSFPEIEDRPADFETLFNATLPMLRHLLIENQRLRGQGKDSSDTD